MLPHQQVLRHVVANLLGGKVVQYLETWLYHAIIWFVFMLVCDGAQPMEFLTKTC